MSNLNTVGWFEIPAINLSRAKDFYQNILHKDIVLDELDGKKVAWFPKIKDREYGATGTIVEKEGYIPSHKGTVIYLSVDSIDDTLKLVCENGGRILMPRKHIGTHGYIANFEDCEGNRIALHSMSN